MFQSRFYKPYLAFIAVISLSGCATLTNDANIPIAVSFSDGASGTCTFSNKRGTWTVDVPSEGTQIRRSDDDLNYTCVTADGRSIEGAIQSEIEKDKWFASVVFLDFGLTDSITDKHRTYDRNPVIGVPDAN
ncbi:MAG: hypothetical protein AAF290_13290 [Pseudomonadota bacterium]